MGASVFVTGGSGYVGRRFLARLDPQQGAEVRVLVRDPEALDPALRGVPGLELVRGDLCEPGPWAERLEGVSHVVHLAAVTGKARPRQYEAVHVDGTRNLLEAAAAARVRGFLHVSTIAVTFPDQTRYFYAQTKQRAEELVAASGLPHTIVRPTMVVGPDAPVLEGLARLACAFVMPVFGRGTVKVQPIGVDDLADLLRDLLEAEFRGDVIEAGGAEVLGIEALMRRIRARRTGKRPRALHLPLRFVRRILCMLEPLLLPVLPITAGQLATFANDGTAAPHAILAARAERLAPLDTLLGGGPADA